MSPITGIRYKCNQCNEYDLCDTCETKNIVTEKHTSSHVLMKIRVPLASTKKEVIHSGIKCNECGVVPIVGVRYNCQSCEDFDLCEKCESSTRHPPKHVLLKLKQPLVPRQQEQKEQKKQAKEEPQGKQGVPKDEKEKEKEKESSSPDCLFVSDASYEDGSLVTVNEVVTKKWHVKNNSSSVWPDGTFLQFIGGQILPNQPLNHSVPKAKPGTTVLVSVDVKMPSEPGRYRGYYRLARPSNSISSPPTAFGHNLWIEATVAPKVNPPAPAPAPTPVVTVTPVARPVLPVIDPIKQSVTILSQPPKTVEAPKPIQQQQPQQQQQQPQQQEAPIKPVEQIKPLENKPVVSESKIAESPKVEKKEVYTGPYAAEVETIRKMGFEEPTELILRLLSSAMQNKRSRISPVDWVVHKLVEKRY